MIRVLVYLALFAAAADAACSKGCSGHGTCGDEDLCKCFPRWTRPDCSTRECPYGPSWVAQQSADATKQVGPATGVLGGRHGYTVCSSKGECNDDSGECECYAGYTGLACSRQSCPEDCSGHGRCVTNLQADPMYTYANKFVSEFWDADKARLCACDRGWQGYACDKRICPVGADPLTCAKNKNEPTVQRITLKNMDFPFAMTAKFKAAITLTFKDMFNGEYMTQPIRLKGRSRGLEDTAEFGGDTFDLRPCVKDATIVDHDACSQSGAWTALNQYDNTEGEPFAAGAGVALEDFDANRIRFALEALPNFAIPMVNVTDVYPLDGDTNNVEDLRYNNHWYFDVTFTHSANAGAQELMSCTISSPASDNAAASPRMGSPTIWEHTTSLEECFDSCTDANKMFRVNLRTSQYFPDGGADDRACSKATGPEECDGYCTWTGDVQEADNSGYCSPTPNSCLRDSGDGHYLCDGAAPGVPLYTTMINHKGNACTTIDLPIEDCTGGCYWDGSTSACVDSEACDTDPDDYQATPVDDVAGCPTGTGALIQGNALFTTSEAVYTGSRMSFENGNGAACVGGTETHGLCSLAETVAACNGECEWNAALDDDQCTGGKQIDITTACNTVSAEDDCVGTCVWRRAKLIVQDDLNVGMWWSKPESLNAVSDLKRESNAVCNGATEEDCNGGCYWDGVCKDRTLVNTNACSAAVSKAECDGGCYWNVGTDDDTATEGTCEVATAMRRTAPTCEVSHIATPKSAETHICSNRGVCDESTGLCGCFEGYAGEDCALQNIYF